jgi:hypothetical protein
MFPKKWNIPDYTKVFEGAGGTINHTTWFYFEKHGIRKP